MRVEVGNRGFKSDQTYNVFVEMPENEEEVTAVYTKMVHKGASDEVNRANSKQTPSIKSKSLILAQNERWRRA